MNQTEKWISWLTSNDERKWKKATLALGDLSCDSDVDVPSLISALDSEVDDVVFWCIGALGALGERSVDAIDKLIELTDSECLGVKQASISSLSRIGPDNVELNHFLVRKLSDSDDLFVCDVLRAFIAMNTVGDDEIETIKRCLTHSSSHVAFQAEVTLRNIMLTTKDA
ncbi:HEAT repeat domain-containing protein [Grimontia sp. SpTr1]|uniref:HEAT repeat domain-containing protein n=1 Tax=Grimontia sp. SpTr1 TaxID=2995319 RepID=UPI00248B5E28|nr:HEAT repeat domain-containing protein [Grimontia sp. SpTr1]